MKKAELLQGIRKMRFEDVYRQRKEKSLAIEEAARLLGICERTFRRWCESYEEEGPDGLMDGRMGKIAHNAAPTDEVIELINLFETRYSNFTVAHFYEKYLAQHKGQRSYTWVKRELQEAGLVKKAKKRGAHRRKRARQPMKGMMLHQDGSTHEWVADFLWDLIVTMDDADSEIYAAFFVEEEGTWSSFQGIKEVILKHGLFCSMYVDRASHYFYTPNEGGKVDYDTLTQFGRALSTLGIDLIPAYSPEARGRSERMFRTLQDRLPKELTLAGITTMEEANRFLKEQLIPDFNRRFMVKPQEESSAFVPWLDANMNLDDILCIHEQRTVNKDNTIRYNNKILQLSKDSYRFSYHKTKVKVLEYVNGSCAVFHGPRCLGRYNADGKLINATQLKECANG
jgi:transposase